MSHKPKYCPICYHDVTKCKVLNEQQVVGVKQIIKCPQCNVILNCDSESVNVRCNICQKLFADVLTYCDHKDNGVCVNV